MTLLSAAAELDQRILAAVAAIPRGQIASYGVVAARVGLPRGARRVARALANNESPELPWHRVLRAGGRIAFPVGSAAFAEQAARLRKEGHELRGSLVKPATGRSLDAALWAVD